MSDQLIWCTSVEDVEIPSKNSDFFSPKDWKTKIRFLQGPVLSYISQQWEDHKPVWEKIRYKFDDPEVKKDKNATLVMSYLVFIYDTKEIKVWEIGTKWIMEQLKSINEMQPDLSAFDVMITKTKKDNWFPDYKIANWAPKSFLADDKTWLTEVIAEIKENWLVKRLETIEENRTSSLEEDQKAIEKEIADKKAWKTKEATVEDAEEEFR